MVERPSYDPLDRVSSFLGLGRLPLERDASRGFDVSLDEIDAGLRQGARAVVVTNLHNPSGKWLSREAVGRIVDLCARAHATLVVDEVYLDAASLTAGHSRWTAAGLADNVVATGSLTKVYGLGGLRAGWLIASLELAERARDVMDLLSVENAAPAMTIAFHALSHLDILEARYRSVFDEGQPIFRRWLAQEPLVRGYENFGALFEWVGLPVGVNADRLSDLLAEDYEVRVVPGSFFGVDDHVRLGLTLPASELAEALSRISEALRRILERGVRGAAR